MNALDLALSPERFAVCRLAPDAPVPAGLLDAAFVSVTRTRDELSILCPERLAPAGARCESGWRLIQVAGPLDFALTGVLLSLLDPLARAGVSVFAASTYDTDYLLVQDAALDRARRALSAAGHRLTES